jgi:pimeloyl-ACP methyl ester carboxylesterase
VKTQCLKVQGLDLAYFETGEGPRSAILLHGFPDDAGSMTGLMDRLASAGYRCRAPYLRGYGPSGRAADGDYRLQTIAGDVIALAEDLSPERPVLLIGHDWGAAIAYLAAISAPWKFEHIVTMAVPPLTTFSINLRRHPAQLRRSWYMGFFQLRGLADMWVRRKNFAFIERLWRDWSPGWDYPAERMEAVKATLGAPGSLKAALGYYRQNLSLKPPPLPPIAVPGLVLAGERDGCIGAEMFEGAERAFSALARLEIVEAAGHFMHLERPGDVWRRIEGFLRE